MNKFHSEIIPALLTQMQNTLLSQDPKQKTTLTRMFYALESLCENLGTLIYFLLSIAIISYVL